MIKVFHLGLIVPKSHTLCIMSHCGYLYLFLFAARGTFADDGLARPHSIIIMNVISSHFIAVSDSFFL